MGQVPLVKSTPWADPGARGSALRPQANTPPRVPPEGAVTGETAPRPRRPAQPFLPGPLTCRGPGRPRWAGALSASRRECAERDLRLTPPPRTPRSSLKSNVTAKPSFSKGGWILLAQSLLAGRDFIFRVDLLMALSSLKKTRGGEPPLPRPPPSPEQAHRSLGRAWPSACRAPRAASASSAPPAAGASPRTPTACPQVLAASLGATALVGSVYVQVEACSGHRGCPGWTPWGQEEDWGRRPPPTPRRARPKRLTVKAPASDFLLRLCFSVTSPSSFLARGRNVVGVLSATR